MPDDPNQIDPALLRDQINKLLTAQPPAMPTGTPDDGSSPSWTGLLGRALSGGQAPGYQLRGGEADTSGNRALLNFGVNMLLASGPHAVRPDLLSAAATGLQGAQESLGQDQQRAAQLAAAQYSATRQQQQDRLAALKEALPLLTLQRDQAALAALKGPGATGGTTSTGAAGAGDGTYAGSIIGGEGTGKNPNSSAVGGGQFIDSTWQGFVAAHPEMFAGMTPAQAMAARNDKDFMTKAAPVAVNWLAQENAKTLTAAGVPPSGTSLGISHYLGAGAAAQVMKAPDNALVSSFVSAEAVKANPELAKMTVGEMKARYAKTPDPGFLKPAQPGGTAVAASPPPPAPAPSAASTLPVPPIPPPGGGTRPTAPPPSAPATPDIAPIAGNQFAGPGAPSGGAPRPPGPAVAGNVGAIVGGMKGAGADPTTLAVPPSSPPGGPPAAPGAPAAPTNPAEAVALAVKTGQPVPIPGGQGLTAMPNGNVVNAPPPAAVPVAPAPVAPPDFQMRSLTPSEQAATSYDLDPQTKAAFAVRLQAATTVQQAEAVKKEMAAAIEARRLEADKARLTIESTARKDWQSQMHPTTEQELAASGLRREPNVLYMTDNQGKVTPTAIPVDPRGIQASKDDQERYQKNYAVPYDQVRPLHALLNEMDALKTQVERDPLGGRGGIGAEYARKLQGVLTPLGLNSDMFRDSLGAQQAYEGLSNQLILKLKAMSGTSLGQMSNMDLSFLTSSGPTLMTTPLGRDMMTASLRQILNYQARLYDVATDTIHDAHGGYTLKDLNKKLEAVPDAIPTMPGPKASEAEAQAWLDHHKLKRGTAVYGPDGKLRLWGVAP